MELKEFIKDTVTQIADAVRELNGGKEDYPLIVNPPHKTFSDGKPLMRFHGEDLRVSEVMFNVVLSESNDKKSAFKVCLSNIGMSKNKGMTNEQNTSLSFPLYVAFPSLKVEADLSPQFPFNHGKD